jgi:trans-aconitate methyltransferase
LSQSEKNKLKVKEDLNTYAGIAEFYDTLMTQGYYNYDEISKDLSEIIGNKEHILELGVGTGLVAEHLLKQNSAYKLTGVDNTEAMINQAKARLGDRITYQLQDITKLELEHAYQAAFSVGGCWYFIDDGKDLEFCSHIDDYETCKESLGRVISHLESGGLLALALQDIHTNYTKKLNDELTYSQEIFQEKSGFTKRYSFTNNQGLVAEQLYRYLTIPGLNSHKLFSELGCEAVGLNPTRKFFIYRKR